MTAEEHFTAGQGAIWIQPDGAGTAVAFLGCHGVSSIDVPEGDYNPFFCPDPAQPKRFVASGEEFSPPEAVTLQIVEDIVDTLSTLEDIRCPFPVYVNMVKCGRKDNFDNGNKTFVVDARKITNRSYANLALRSEDTRAEATYDISGAPPLVIMRNAVVAEQNTSETEPLNDIAFCNDERCASGCGGSLDICTQGHIGADAGVAIANVLFTVDKGVTWPAGGANPFIADENVESVACFAISQTVMRHIVARGQEPTPANPAEISYSDDAGTTWTPVDVEAVGTRSANDAGALFALDSKHIWLVLTDGYIMFSADGGITWTTQDAGGASVNDYNGVSFANATDGYAVADSGDVVKTTDGGNTWAAVTVITGTPNVLCVHTFNESNVVVGTVTGIIYRSFDGGTTWTAQFNTGTSINDLDFANDFAGFAVDDDAVLRTRNGGADWLALTTPPNTELNSVYVCNSNLAYAVGESSGNAAFILKISG